MPGESQDTEGVGTSNSLPIVLHLEDGRITFEATLANLAETDADLRRVASELAAVHDAGKASAAFQRQGKPSENPDLLTAEVPISIYIADYAIHEQVESAVEMWLATAGVLIDVRDEPVTGSWFRTMRGKAAQSPIGQEALLTAAHIADSRLVQAHDAHVTAALLQNLGPVLHALQPTKDAVVRAGSLLIVKVDWAVQVHQLNAAQQAILDHQPHLASSPQKVVEALQLARSAEAEATDSSAGR